MLLQVEKHWWVNPSAAVSPAEGQEGQRGSAPGRGGGGLGMEVLGRKMASGV